jgi:hypothetical protein
VSSSRDFGVEQFFRADEFRAVDPSPNFVDKFLFIFEKTKTHKEILYINFSGNKMKTKKYYVKSQLWLLGDF